MRHLGLLRALRAPLVQICQEFQLTVLPKMESTVNFLFCISDYLVITKANVTSRDINGLNLFKVDCDCDPLTFDVI